MMLPRMVRSGHFGFTRIYPDANSTLTAGRLRHFTSVTSPLTLFATSNQLAQAQELLAEYQAGVGKGRAAWGNEEAAGIWRAKQC